MGAGAVIAALAWPLELLAEALPAPPPSAAASEAELDLRLVEQLRGGDRRAARALFRRHADAVHRHLTRLVGPVPDREDLLQEVFTSAFRSLPGFRGEAAFSTWLHSITVHVALDHLRRRKRSRYDVAALAAERAPSAARTPEQQAALVEDLERALGFLDRLKPDKRVAFVLRVLDGRSLVEIGALVGATAATVGQRVKHAQAELSAMVEREARRRKEDR